MCSWLWRWAIKLVVIPVVLMEEAAFDSSWCREDLVQKLLLLLMLCLVGSSQRHREIKE